MTRPIWRWCSVADELTSTGKVRRNTARVDPSIVDGSRFRQGRIIPAVPVPTIRRSRMGI